MKTTKKASKVLAIGMLGVVLAFGLRQCHSLMQL
jgi:hypothetical protein